MRSTSRAFFYMRNHLACLPVVFALFSARAEWEVDALVWPAAIVLCVAGVLLRAWASRHCHYARHEERALAVGGPYAYLRHPLYVGNILIIAGATFASELVWLVPLSILWSLLVYQVAVVYEDRKLMAWFGDDYRRYRSMVRAWLPVTPRPTIPRHCAATRTAPLGAAVATQSFRLLALLPFVLKELGALGLGHR